MVDRYFLISLLPAYTAFLLFSCQTGYCQSTCALDSTLHQVIENSPDKWEHFRQSQIENTKGSIRIRNQRYLPVVFHVVALDGQVAISDDQITSQLESLNRDFRGQTPLHQSITDEVKAFQHDTGLRFCLADVDPSGNPSSGIQRITTSITDIGLARVSNGRSRVHYTDEGGLDAWPSERYINVWIAELGGLSGKTTLPGMANFQEEIGIVIDPRSFGSFFFGLGASKTLTHEMGHYFGLLHPWGIQTGDCEEFDLAEDTPKQLGPTFSCSQQDVQCSDSSPVSSSLFMNFGPDGCLGIFTPQQTALMQGALQSFYPELGHNDCELPWLALDKWESIRIWQDKDGLRIHSDLPFDQPISYEVYDVIGRKWSEGVFLASNEFIPIFQIDAFPTQIYLIVFRSAGNVLTRKVFIH